MKYLSYKYEIFILQNMHEATAKINGLNRVGSKKIFDYMAIFKVNYKYNSYTSSDWA